MDISVLKIGERLNKFRKDLNLSQINMAQSLEIPQSTLSEMEKGRKNVSYNTIISLISNYSNLNVDWLLTGRGNMLNENDSNKKIDLNDINIAAEPMEKYNVLSTPNLVHLNDEFVHLNTVKLANKASKNILVPVKAFGGYLGEWTQEYIDQDLVYVDIPGSPQDARTFEISGTSMEPVIMHGDHVVTKRIDKFEQIKKGHMYVIISLLQGITVKYVYDSGDSLILEPANRLEHIPLVISKADIREIWQVVLRLTKHIIDTEKALYQVQKTKHNPNTNTV
jgi:transcriptional regulator with XRE-family HTH domain